MQNLQNKKTDRRFTLITISHSSVVRSTIFLKVIIAALFTSTSILFHVAIARSTDAFISSSLPTSHLLKIAMPLFFVMISTVSCPPFSSRSIITTCPPSDANLKAVALPIPEPAPVTKQTLLVNLIYFFYNTYFARALHKYFFHIIHSSFIQY